jgi:hypothetical protein
LDYALRFLAGGLIVSAFAVLGDVLRPKRFAGLFGAAPSVALATLTLAIFKDGAGYVATEGRSMIIGAAAFLLYSFIVCQLLMRSRIRLDGNRWHPRRLAGGRLRPQATPDRIMTVIRAKLSALRESRWYEYVVRFVLGGATTLIAGVISDKWGPETGGLFLAFPAILCASATLVESHERREKRARGLEGHRRGTDAAALDTAGAALGSIGLAAFAFAIWKLAPTFGKASLAFGSIAWLLVSVTLWRLRRYVRRPK